MLCQLPVPVGRLHFRSSSHKRISLVGWTATKNDRTVVGNWWLTFTISNQIRPLDGINLHHVPIRSLNSWDILYWYPTSVCMCGCHAHQCLFSTRDVDFLRRDMVIWYICRLVSTRMPDRRWTFMKISNDFPGSAQVILFGLGLRYLESARFCWDLESLFSTSITAVNDTFRDSSQRVGEETFSPWVPCFHFDSVDFKKWNQGWARKSIRKP